MANIYKPSQGKVQLGRLNPKPIQQLNFYLKKKKHSTQNSMHLNAMMSDFQFKFSFIFKKYFKNVIQKHVKIFNYIYKNYSVSFFSKIGHHTVVVKSLLMTMQFISPRCDG